MSFENKIIGFIGCGNMGSAMISGILESKLVESKNIFAAVKSKESALDKENKLGIKVCCNNAEVAKKSDILFLAVKPQFMDEILEEIKNEVSNDTVIISIAAGKDINYYEKKLGEDKKIIRAMPNTPSMVKEGMMGICINCNVQKEEIDMVKELCMGFSKTEVVPENLMGVVTAVSGSSPAYVFMFIEAMADAAVLGGMPRKQAYEFAAQAVLGSAKMVLETKKHPGELKDMVCSPAGTTIQAVKTLEKEGMRSAVFEAVEKCIEASNGLK
ncbi:pyrroline-5-carboxylate reductase [Lachnobacterium bovis]|uniref:pyrroline-5-carboxylate reductase n=1 Tax=Lachnobacterium bovis TaxID=140626 RepID=UPI0003B57093|nr:pyrroline-5-carboxylate reductase [Lachnobacterium bovis]